MLRAAVATPVLAGLLVSLVSAAEPAAVRWYPDLEAAHQESLRSRRPMLLVFTAEWCGYCKKMEKGTLAEARVANYINSAFVPVHLDLEKYEEAADLLKVESLPCSVVLSPDAALLGKLVGNVDAPRYYKGLQAAAGMHLRVQQAKGERPVSRR